MKDISLHLLDVIENAAKAGAPSTTVTLKCEGNFFSFTVEDRGPGLPRAMADDPTDPYRTTRTERPVGLGLALLRAAAEQSGGSLVVDSTPDKGVRLQASFDMSGIDAKPLGDVVGALLTAALGWSMNLRVRTADQEEDVLDTAAVRAELDGIPLAHPRVRAFLESALREGLAEVLSKAERIFARRITTREGEKPPSPPRYHAPGTNRPPR